ncbi:hypothetical protein ACFQZ4_06940 [Catellatospora coxensis]|uniref:Uncharacterized protein n=1 Tax=Catellatospora coxensis TaxID=310354 RepID=A0A8J3PB16_9ACTN|nr:hypothetical protein [Catellatospora coxensis]GIG10412.1 hypothetical protein Cco03nite_71120 [Catellatospora coxensis]
MSWFMVAMPLHVALENGGLARAADASLSFGLPDEPPVAGEPPTVVQVLSAFRQAGCHGDAWFRLAVPDCGTGLAVCPDHVNCSTVGGLDLGEVMLGVDGRSRSEPLEPGDAVTDIGFRKPAGGAVLAAILALASQSGPWLVCDDGGDCVFVVSPGDDPAHLAAHWPW